MQILNSYRVLPLNGLSNLDSAINKDKNDKHLRK